MSEATVNAEIGDKEVKEFFEEGKEPVETQEATQEEKETVNAVREEKREETPKEERKVNYGALHEERMRRKELQGKVEKMEARFSQLMERLQPQEEIPSVEIDPIKHFDSRLVGLEKVYNEREEAIRQQQLEAEVINNYQQSAAIFASDNPDFGEAYKHYIGSRINELQAMGYNSAEAKSIANREEFDLAVKSIKNEMNPAASIYAAAKARGYKKAEPVVDKKIETIEKGVAASRVTGGASNAGKMTLEALAEMDDADFAANWDKIVGKI